MGTELITNTIKIPDRDKLAANATKIAKFILLGGLAVGASIFLLPWITLALTNIIYFGIMLLICVPVVLILLNGATWRAVNRFARWVSMGLLKMSIEMDRWQVLYDAVDETAGKYEVVKTQNANLRGFQVRTKDQIAKNEQLLRDANDAVGIIQDTIRKMSDPDERQLELLKLQEQVANQNNAKEFIDDVKPTLNTLDFLVNYTDKLYKRGQTMVKIARSQIDMKKEKTEIVTSAASAVNSAQSAMAGNSNKQKDAAIAWKMIADDTSRMMGQITQGIQVTADIMSTIDLNDAVKMKQAVEIANQFNIDEKFNYAETVKTDAAHLTDSQKKLATGNEYADFLMGDKK